MSRETDFLAQWNAEKAAYDAWGRAVSQRVTGALGLAIAPVSSSYFLKLPVEPRLKDDQKLIEKAFFRNKRYADPFSDITDKVGTRFVVLLGSEIEVVESALKSILGWTLSKDRDYEVEQKENPFEFNYAAVHYIVRPNEDEEYDGVRVPAGTPCEVQIKTLLQHAFSELTHDTIYKPQIQATPAMQRNAAKAMALLEATNDYFEKVATQVEHTLSQVRKMTADLTEVYRRAIGIDPKPTILEGMLIEAFEGAVDGDYLTDIEALFVEKGFLPALVRQRVADRNPIFAQPSVLLAYLVASRSARRAENKWPLTPQELEPLLNDLGESVS